MAVQKSDRIVVTGGAGFLGSFVMEKLRARGYTNVIVPRRREYDLTHEDGAQRLYKDFKPDVVVHMAAEVGGIGANRDNPGRYFFANMSMGLHLIEGARQYGLKKFVQVGTICAYPKFTPVPFKESDLWDGYPEETNAPYGVAKKALLVMAQAYRQEFGSNFVVLFTVNLYGPRDNFDLASSHVIPALIRKMIDSPEEIVLWGDGTPTREYLYVDDCVEGLVLAAEHYDEPDPVNLGTGIETTISETAALRNASMSASCRRPGPAA